MRVGIFGGSFSPVHRGHITIVEQLLASNHLDHIIVVPAYQNPLKERKPELSEELRVALLQASFAELQRVEICSYELQKKEKSYTYLTLAYLKEQAPENDFFLILGEDSFADFDRWKESQAIVKIAKLLIIKRPAAQIDWSRRQICPDAYQAKWVDIDAPTFSSTDIRAASFETIKNKRWLHPQALEVWQKLHPRNNPNL